MSVRDSSIYKVATIVYLKNNYIYFVSDSTGPINSPAEIPLSHFNSLVLQSSNQRHRRQKITNGNSSNAMSGAPVREEEEPRARPTLDISASASSPIFSFSFSVKITDRLLAAGALSGFGVGLAVLLYQKPDLVGNAVRGALEGPGLQVERIGSFLSFIEDFETMKVKQRTEEEFYKVGLIGTIKDQLVVSIENQEEVYEKLDLIR